MGRLFLDAANQHTDPASSGRKVLDAGCAWAAPSSSRKALDAANGWTAPELGKIVQASQIGTCSVLDLIATANAAAKNPGAYSGFIKRERSFTIGGKTVTARIVEVGRQPLQNGGVGGFTFSPYKGMAKYQMHYMNRNTGGYPDSQMKPYLEGLAFDPKVAAGLQPMAIGCPTTSGVSGPVTTIYSKFALMSLANVSAPSLGNTSAVDGFRYTYFADNDTDAARIYYDDSGAAEPAWLLDPRLTYHYATIRFDGVVGGTSGSGDLFVPAARFCLGSSV